MPMNSVSSAELSSAMNTAAVAVGVIRDCRLTARRTSGRTTRNMPAM
jgi:hypothetical protein